MTALELTVLAWSGAALGWWVLALCIVAGRRGVAGRARRDPVERLSVFKALPRLGAGEPFQRVRDAVATFVRELDAGSELLLGIPEDQAHVWEPEVDRWRRQHPAAVIKCVIRPEPDQRANPKVAWHEVLAAHASGPVWLWSDADVLAPRGLLATLRAELDEQRAGAVTCAYRIAAAQRPGDMLDALFVNVEFLPGALLLGRWGGLDFAFGACVLFRAEEFHRRAGWDQLGACLADDFHLGRALRPVRLSAAIVDTCPQSGGLLDSCGHYYRWHKTIRWCRPGGYFLLLLILPLAGWMAGLFAGMNAAVAMLGAAGQCLMESVFGITLLRMSGCRVSRSAGLAVGLWPVARLAAWLAVWLPLPVRWGRSQWWQPRQATAAPAVENPPPARAAASRTRGEPI